MFVKANCYTVYKIKYEFLILQNKQWDTDGIRHGCVLAVNAKHAIQVFESAFLERDGSKTKCDAWDDYKTEIFEVSIIGEDIILPHHLYAADNAFGSIDENTSLTA